MKHIALILTLVCLFAASFAAAQDPIQPPITNTIETVKEAYFKAAPAEDSSVGKALHEKVQRIIGRIGCGAEDAQYMIVPILDVEQTATSSGLVRNVSLVQGMLTLNAVSADNPDMVWYSVSIPLETTLTGANTDPAIALAKQIKVSDAVYVRFVRMARKKIAEAVAEHQEK